MFKVYIKFWIANLANVDCSFGLRLLDCKLLAQFKLIGLTL